MIIIQYSKTYPIYKNARNAAWYTLIKHHVTALPVDVFAIARAEDICVKSYSNSISLLQYIQFLSDTDILDTDGFCVELFGKRYILYNDHGSSAQRIRFTIAHELGHFLTGQPLVEKKRFFLRARVSHNTSKSWDDEESPANVFASRLLAPSCVLWGLQLHTPQQITTFCDISLEAASIRAQRMEILYTRGVFLSNSLEQTVYHQFADYITRNIQPEIIPLL